MCYNVLYGAAPVSNLIPLFIDDPGADINHRDNLGHTVLNYAISSQRSDTIRMLMQQLGLNVNQLDNNGATSLMLDAGNNEIIFSLGPSADFEDYLPTLALELVQRGVKINATDTQGRTALYYAATNDHLALTKQLLKLGANINIADHHSNTPLHQVAFNNHDYMVTRQS